MKNENFSCHEFFDPFKNATIYGKIYNNCEKIAKDMNL